MIQCQDTLLGRLRSNPSRRDWDLFVDLYGPLLKYWAQRHHPADGVADLVQDVLVLVMEKLPSFAGKDERSFLAWLRAVLLNRQRDLWRRATLRPGSADPATLDGCVEDQQLREVGEADERAFLVRRALQIMKSDFAPTTWRACWESVVAERPMAEVAAELGVSVAVVHSARYRVIRRLRSELGELVG